MEILFASETEKMADANKYIPVRDTEEEEEGNFLPSFSTSVDIDDKSLPPPAYHDGSSGMLPPALTSAPISPPAPLPQLDAEGKLIIVMRPQARIAVPIIALMVMTTIAFVGVLFFVFISFSSIFL